MNNKISGGFHRMVHFLVVPRRQVMMQGEINRLRKVLHEIADSRPDEHMDIEHTPELTKWICDACRRARVGAYPHNATEQRRVD